MEIVKKWIYLYTPDFIFSFPVSSPPKNPISLDYSDLWRNLMLESTYSCFEEWSNLISETNKKLIINKYEIEKINDLLQKKILPRGL